MDFDNDILCIPCAQAPYPSILTSIDATLFQSRAKRTCGFLAIAPCLLATANIQYSLFLSNGIVLSMYRQLSQDRRLLKVIGESVPLPGDIFGTFAVRCRRRIEPSS